jgi:foldase protein PrsA
MRHLLVWIAATVAVVLSGCGASPPAGDDFPDQVIAHVGERTLTGPELEGFMAEVRASYAAHHRPFPDPGSAEYANLTARAIEVLVARMQDELTAAELGISVSDAEVEATLERHRRLEGEEEFERTLDEAGVSLERVRADLRAKIIENAIFAAVVSGVSVTDEELRAYYDAHVEDYTRWPPRLVDYLFVRDEALARQLVERIRAGEDFLALAEEYGDPGADAGRITIETDGPGLLPFEQAAFTLEAGEISLTHSGVGWSIVRPVSPREPGRLLPFEDVVDTLRLELTERERKRVMDEWTKENEAKLAALTSYRPGWHPGELRREAPFPVPRESQRRWAECGLPEGEYTYEQLVELGCAGDFPIPGVDGPLCPEPLVEDPYVGGFGEAELESGYADYLTSDESSCVGDPRGQTLGFARRPVSPGLSNLSPDG